MNRYKVDWNTYFSSDRPYALYGRRQGWFTKWEFVHSFATKDEAVEAFRKLIGLPIYLDERMP